MSEEIIINGINVAECEYLQEDYTRYDLCGNKHKEHNKCEIMTAYEDLINECQDNHNCYFKQLQRLKQENEKLIKINNDFAETHKTIGQDLYKECVSLRSELTVQKEVAKAFSRGLEQTEKLLGKYKQTLEEIRERCNNILSNILNHSQSKVDFAEQIKKKINEVLE